MDLREILFLTVTKNEIKFHTRDGIFVPPLSLYDYSLILAQAGFDSLAQSNLVNIKKITRYDSDSNIAFFDFKNLPSLGCNVSRRNRYKLKHLIDDQM